MQTEKSGQEYLEQVLVCLEKRLEEVNASIEAGVREIEDMHEYYWENYTEMDQYGYEEFDNRQALLAQVNANQEQLLLRKRFRNMQDSPFFGRVDFIYQGDEEPEQFYIGIGNLAERAGSRPLVNDWRAPVSGLFYDYDKGPASYEAPQGVFEGEISSKWQYKIRRGKLVYEFESDIKIDDDILKAELGGSGEVQLKNIIRTIQKEQNAIIRNTEDRIMVIQGTAGSGKTSVALHRIAYLLYHDRKNLKSSNILILSPNSVFADYISHILPELGEENIREMSFDLFAYRELQDVAADCEDKYDQIEKAVKNPDTWKQYREKQSPEFVSRLQGFMMSLEDELMNFRDVEYKGCSIKESEIIRLFYFRFQDIPLLSRMEAVAEYFIDQVETLRDRDLSEEEKDEVTEKFLGMYGTRDFYVLYSRFLDREGFRPLPRRPLEKRRLKYEDVYPVLYLKYHLTRCRAQTMEEKQQDVMKFLPGIFGRNIRKIYMNRSYRNTVEIAEYANRLAGITGMELFERHGEPVREETFESTEKALNEVLKIWLRDRDRLETGAVIFMTEKEAEAAGAYLKQKLETEAPEQRDTISYLDRNSGKFCKGLTVTTFYLAKGLEFDRVYGVFMDSDKSPLKIQAEYITATRALHELFMYTVRG